MKRISPTPPPTHASRASVLKLREIVLALIIDGTLKPEGVDGVVAALKWCDERLADESLV